MDSSSIIKFLQHTNPMNPSGGGDPTFDILRSAYLRDKSNPAVQQVFADYLFNPPRPTVGDILAQSNQFLNQDNPSSFTSSNNLIPNNDMNQETFKGQPDNRSDVEKGVGSIPVIGGLLGFLGDASRGLSSGVAAQAGNTAKAITDIGAQIGGGLAGKNPNQINQIQKKTYDILGINPSYNNPFEKGAQAFSNEGQAQNIGDYLGVQDPVLKTISNVAGGIAFDPLTYVPGVDLGNVAGKIGNTAMGTGKLLTKAGEKIPVTKDLIAGARNITPLTDNIDNAITDASKIFKPSPQDLNLLERSGYLKNNSWDIAAHPELANRLNRWGLNNLNNNDLQKISQISKDLGQEFKTAISSLDSTVSVPVTDLQGALSSSLNNEGLVSPQIQNVSSAVDNLLISTLKNGSMNNAVPSQLIDAANKIANMSTKYFKPTASVEEQSIGRGLRDIYNNILDRFDNGTNGSVLNGVGLPDNSIAKIQSTAELTGKNNGLIDQLKHINTVRNYKNLQQGLLFGRDLTEQAVTKAKNTSSFASLQSQVANQAFQKAKRVVADAQTSPKLIPNVNTNNNVYKLGQIIGNISNKASDKGAAFADSNIGKLLGSTPIGTFAYPSNLSGKQFSPPNQLIGSDGQEQKSTDSILGSAQTLTTEVQKRQAVRNYLTNQLLNNGYKPAEIKTLIDLQYPQLKVNINDSKIMQGAQYASGAVDQLEKAFNNMGGPTGIGGDIITGNIRKVLAKGGIDTGYRQYQALADPILGNLGRSLGGETGALSNQDIDRIRQLLPNAGDDNSTAKFKFNTIRQLIANKLGTATYSFQNPNAVVAQ